MKNRSPPPPRGKRDSSAPSRPPRPQNGPRGRGNGESSRPTPRITINLYGHHAVRAAILNPDRVIHALYATPDQADMVDEWVRLAERRGVDRPGIHMPDRAAFEAALPRDAVHQGVGAACDPLADLDLADILRDVGDGPGVFVLLDQITDPHNLGAILRSACAFGAGGVIVQRRHTPDINGLIAKTACGAVEHIPVAYETNLSRAIDQCKEAGFIVIGLDEGGDPLSHHPPSESRNPTSSGPQFSPGRQDRILLVLGAEGPGLRRLIREGCDHLVSLPTPGPISSLNVSNAAAVALYHFCQR